MIDPENWKPETADELIGPARAVCTAFVNKARRNQAAGRYPAEKLLLLGEPGNGKTSITHILARELAGDPINIDHINGTDLNVDKCREIASRYGQGNLFGATCYTVLHVDELDLAPPQAQKNMLTMIDKMPDNWAFIASSNAAIDDFEQRFQTRFKQVAVDVPSAAEIQALLEDRFQIPTPVANQIAGLNEGNVRAALLDAQCWYDANYDSIAA